MSVTTEVSFPNRENNLLEVVKELSEFSQSEIVATTQLLLGRDSYRPPVIFHSRLNNDGSPLQFCVTVTQDGESLRMIGDPKSDISDINVRHTCALVALSDTLAVKADASLENVVKETLANHLPVDLAAHPGLQAGTLWLGVALGPTGGIALYLNGQWGTPQQQWERVRRWLSQRLPDDTAREKIFSHLSECAIVTSVGLEGVSDQHLRYKLYFRLTDRVSFGELGIDLLQAEPLAYFLDSTMTHHELPNSGLVFCLGFSPKTGAISDAKIDLCGHCLAPIVTNWPLLLETLAEQLELPLSSTFQAAARHHLTEIAFLGCGVKHDGSLRLNLYLKGR